MAGSTSTRPAETSEPVPRQLPTPPPRFVAVRVNSRGLTSCSGAQPRFWTTPTPPQTPRRLQIGCRRAQWTGRSGEDGPRARVAASPSRAASGRSAPRRPARVRTARLTARGASQLPDLSRSRAPSGCGEPRGPCAAVPLDDRDAPGRTAAGQRPVGSANTPSHSRRRLVDDAGDQHLAADRTGSRRGTVATVTPLPEDDAVRLLADIAGTRRVEGDEASAREVVRLCGRLPLAVCIVGSQLASRPHQRLPDMAAELVDEQRRLTRLTAEGTVCERSSKAATGSCPSTRPGLPDTRRAARSRFQRQGHRCCGPRDRR